MQEYNVLLFFSRAIYKYMQLVITSESNNWYFKRKCRVVPHRFSLYDQQRTQVNKINVIAMFHSRQWRGLRPSVLGQDWYDTKKSVLVLQVWCCVVKHGLVTLVVIMTSKDTGTFQVLFIVSIFCSWNITTVDINSGVRFDLKIKSAKCLCLLPMVLVLRIWSCLHYWLVTDDHKAKSSILVSSRCAYVQS